MPLVARIDVVPVEVDVAAALRMLEGITERASGARLSRLIERAAQGALGRISGVPVGPTGDLARGFAVRVRGDTAIDIVNTEPYARFVFRGTRYMDAQPPNVPADALARELAAAVAREVFG